MENFLGCLMELTENSVLDGAENQYSLTALVKRVLFFLLLLVTLAVYKREDRYHGGHGDI